MKAQTWRKLRKDKRFSITEMALVSGPGQDDDISFHSFALLVRWLQAVAPKQSNFGESKPLGDAKPSLLLEHVESDSLCPCPSCVGSNITASCALLCLLGQSLVFLYPLIAGLALGTYTAFVAFGSLWWALWWTKLIAGILCEIVVVSDRDQACADLAISCFLTLTLDPHRISKSSTDQFCHSRSYRATPSTRRFHRYVIFAWPLAQ